MAVKETVIEGLSDVHIVTDALSGSKGVVERHLPKGRVEVKVIKTHAWHKEGDIVIWRKWF